MLTVQDYLNKFEQGKDFSPPSRGVFTNNKHDLDALNMLEKHMISANPGVQENIVALLVDMGLQTSSLKSSGAEVLFDQHIIEILATSGIKIHGLGREAVMDALRKLVIPGALTRYDEAFSDTLITSPTEEAFLLVAKAKSFKAKPIVEKLLSTTWKDSEVAKIAHAALGNIETEDEFLQQLEIAETAKDAKAFSYALGSLSLIGTKRSLQAIARHLRTPIILEIPNVYDKSLRLAVLEALLYNYPPQPVLYPNNIIEESDYSAAEKFCTETLDVTYSTPPPPFFTIGGYPLQ